MGEVLTFGPGARGFLVEALQGALQAFLGRSIEGGCDGLYATHTVNAVQDAARQIIQRQDAAIAIGRQLELEGALVGCAGPALFGALGLDWPEEFARCMQLTMFFEGTGFSGTEGPKQTGDNAGVTHGAIGMTSGNGELQMFLRSAWKEQPSSFSGTAVRAMIDDKVRLGFYGAIADGAANSAMASWALTSDGDVRGELRSFLAALGTLDWYKHLQMQWAYTRYWLRACEQSARLFVCGVVDDSNRVVTVPTVRCKALLFDVWVQDGGLRSDELSALCSTLTATRHTAQQAMSVVANCVAERVRRNGGPAKDVESRKTAIADGSGTVHGEQVVIGSWAL